MKVKKLDDQVSFYSHFVEGLPLPHTPQACVPKKTHCKELFSGSWPNVAHSKIWTQLIVELNRPYLYVPFPAVKDYIELFKEARRISTGCLAEPWGNISWCHLKVFEMPVAAERCLFPASPPAGSLQHTMHCTNIHLLENLAHYFR